MADNLKQQTSTFFKEFQAFITKGNVIDLAVAVIIGPSLEVKFLK